MEISNYSLEIDIFRAILSPLLAKEFSSITQYSSFNTDLEMSNYLLEIDIFRAILALLAK